MIDKPKPWMALGWTVGQLSGWGQFGAHFARTVSQAGYRVILTQPPELAGILPLDWPAIEKMLGPVPEDEPGWLLMPLGNAIEAKPEGLPAHIKVAGIIFCEDVGVFDSEGVARLNGYDVIVAGSRWTERVMRERGVERVILAHQGYDSRVFFPPADAIVSPKVSENTAKYPANSATKTPVRIFSGGKLEFRKGQDIVVEAFKRFRQTPEGKDAVLVVAWENMWPATMDGIWLSGYVKGVPAVRNGRLDIVSWLVANGVPAEAVIDCGRMTPPELAHVLRSCTVGIFPNRAESGTNLVLVEALASGLPIVLSDGHGHDDVWRMGLLAGDEVPGGCRLYKSTEGWREASPEAFAQSIATASRIPGPVLFPDYWCWSIRGPAMAEAIANTQFVYVQ